MGHITETQYQLKNGHHATVRTGIADDAVEYLKLEQSIIGENIYSLIQTCELTCTVEQKRDWLKANFENPNHLIIVVDVNGKLVGQCDFSNGHRKRNAHTGDFGMGIDKDHRGQGIGSLMLATLISWAKGNPLLEKINLTVHHTNDRAIALYQKVGFVQEGLRTKDLKYGEHDYVDTVLMGLVL